VEDVRELSCVQIDDERLALYRHAAPSRCWVPHLENAQSAYVSIRQHTSAYVIIRQRTSAKVRIRRYLMRRHKAPLCVGGEAEELQVVARYHLGMHLVGLGRHSHSPYALGPAA
jgi:hypothetical protein